MIASADVRDLLTRVDLMALVSAEVALRRESVSSWAGPCPWCGGRDRLYVKPEDGHWRCRRCDRHGDAIGWMRELHGLTFPQAVEALGGTVLRPEPRRRTEHPTLAPVPSREWRAAGEALVHRCEVALRTPAGAGALAYLHGRGLSDETIRAARVGFSCGEVFAGLRVPGPSIVLPWHVGGQLWALKVRMLEPKGDGPRYLSVTWDAPALRERRAGGTPTLYGAATLPGRSTVILVEGELDALLLVQHVGDLVGVATLGGAGKAIDGRSAWLLLEAQDVLIAYDLDEAGEKGARALLADIGGARRVYPPTLTGKDIGDAWREGADLRAWVTGLLAELDTGQPAQATKVAPAPETMPGPSPCRPATAPRPCEGFRLPDGFFAPEKGGAGSNEPTGALPWLNQPGAWVRMPAPSPGADATRGSALARRVAHFRNPPTQDAWRWCPDLPDGSCLTCGTAPAVNVYRTRCALCDEAAALALDLDRCPTRKEQPHAA